MLVIHGVLDHIDDLDLRVHHRSMMEQAGLFRIIEKCREFGYEQIDTYLDLIEGLTEADERALREQHDQEVLKNYGDPEDVFKAIVAKTKDTRAHDYFLSALHRSVFWTSK